MQGRVTKSWKKKHQGHNSRDADSSYPHEKPSTAPTHLLPFSLSSSNSLTGQQQHLSLGFIGMHTLWTLLPPRALTVGMASQPHGGAPCPGEPGVGCQVRSGVCRPAPGARQGWAPRHHQVGVQAVGGTAGGVYSGKICQLLAFSGDGGGKRETVSRCPNDGRGQECGPARRSSVCKPGSVTQGQL